MDLEKKNSYKILQILYNLREERKRISNRRTLFEFLIDMDFCKRNVRSEYH